jgi:hypothetical protein
MRLASSGSRLLISLAVLGCLVTEGCQDATRAVVFGTVTLDGRPLDVGTISFIPTGSTKGPVAGATIIDGKYRIDPNKGAIIGTNRIVFYGMQRTGRKISDGQESVEEYVNAIPPKYGDPSTLVRTIQPGENEFTFELSSK